MTPGSDSTEHSLSQCGVIVKEKHRSDEKLYGESDTTGRWKIHSQTLTHKGESERMI